MAPFPDVPLPAREPKRFLPLLSAGGLALGCLVLLMGILSLRESLRNRRQRALITAQNLAQVLDHYVADTFAKVDFALMAVKDEAERAARERRPGPDDLNEFMCRQRERIDGVDSLRTTDAWGRVDHSIGIPAGLSLMVGDREYFLQLRDDPAAGLVISKPLLDRVSKDWVIVMGRRLEGPGHRFTGIVHAVLPLDRFQEAFSSLNMGPRGAVVLRSLDLGLVVGNSESERVGTTVGEKAVSPEFQTFVQSGQAAGSFRARRPYDGIQRTLAARRVAGWPFYLLVGVADRDALAGWGWEVAQEALEMGLILGMIAVGVGLIRRKWLEQQAAHSALEQLLAEVKTLGGMLPICSHCKKIRDDKGYWNQIEAYLNEHTDAEFTHGICPDCAKEVFPRSSGKHTAI